MAQLKRWTKEEDHVVVNQVARHANNLSDGFRQASRLTGRTEAACSIHWYKVLRHQEETGICFALIGKGTKSINKKNQSSPETEKTLLKWWKAFLRFLKS